MEVVVTTGAIRRAKLQLNCHHQQTNLVFSCKLQADSRSENVHVDNAGNFYVIVFVNISQTALQKLSIFAPISILVVALWHLYLLLVLTLKQRN